jgi:uncharacterized protein YcsI (UPF0317 family)
MADLAAAEPAAVRALIRTGQLAGPTAGMCMDVQQANLVVVPAEHADDFEGFCLANPRACPLLERTAPGAVSVSLARDADLRTDLGRYRVFRDGRLVAEPTDVCDQWRSDAVAFLLGCSLGFEAALRAAGVPVRHLEARSHLPMYITDRRAEPSGPFSGPLVVSMRPVPEPLVDTAVAVTSALPWCHGAPVHVGDPQALGIYDLDRPSFGDPPASRPGDTPAFWACGVTPQLAVPAARLPYAITHCPGHMLITDVPVAEASLLHPGSAATPRRRGRP